MTFHNLLRFWFVILYRSNYGGLRKILARFDRMINQCYWFNHACFCNTLCRKATRYLNQMCLDLTLHSHSFSIKPIIHSETPASDPTHFPRHIPVYLNSQSLCPLVISNLFQPTHYVVRIFILYQQYKTAAMYGLIIAPTKFLVYACYI